MNTHEDQNSILTAMNCLHIKNSVADIKLPLRPTEKSMFNSWTVPLRILFANDTHLTVCGQGRLP